MPSQGELLSSHGSSGSDTPSEDEETPRPTISIVFPTKNEEAGIAECIEKARRALDQVGVGGEIVVSDSSTDRTPEIARSMGATVVTPDKEGYGYAYRYAFDRVSGEYVVMCDADLTYDIEELDQLLQPLLDDEADIVLGSRFDGTIHPGAMPFLHKYVGNPLLTWFLNAFYDAGVSDAHTGFRVFRRSVVDEVSLSTDGMEFASELLMRVAVADFRIVEIPIDYRQRTGDPTINTFEDGWRHVKFMLVNSPRNLFTVPATVTVVSGLIVMLLGFWNVKVYGQPIGIHSLIAGSLLTVVGYQVGWFAVLTDTVDTVEESRTRLIRRVQRGFSLERGASVGVATLLAGVCVAIYLIVRWIQSGFVELPSIRADVVAFTTIVVGIQTVFGSFFMDMLQSREQ